MEQFPKRLRNFFASLGFQWHDPAILAVYIDYCNWDQCGKSYSRSGNLEMHRRTCTGPIVAPAPKRRRTASAVPEFTVRRKRRALGGTSEMY